MNSRTVYVYAEDEEEAKRFAAGEDGYEPFYTQEAAEAAAGNPEQCREGDSLYSVETVVSQVVRRIDPETPNK